jgi:hypothetical protein
MFGFKLGWSLKNIPPPDSAQAFLTNQIIWVVG